MPKKKHALDEEYVRGWVPPGYDNLGPGNEVRIGPAGRSEGDAVARTHDIGYGEEEERGVDPYWNWVDADEEFLQNLPIEGPSTLVAKGLFSAKKAAKNIGLVIGDMSGRKGKRKAKAPVRENPWDEGENYRKAREEKRKRREDNDATRDEAWEMARTGRDHAYETIERYRATGNWQPDENVYNAQQNREIWQAARDRQLAQGIDWGAFPESAAMQGWVEHMTDLNGEGATGLQVPRPEAGPSVPNLPDTAEDDPMDSSGPAAPADDPMGETALARAPGGGPNSVSKETPISPYPSLTFGLQETHTTILPWTAWLSVSLPQWTVQTQTQMKMRMNSPYDMLESTLSTSPAVGAAPTVNGLYGCPFDQTGKRVNNGNVAYPQTIAAGANAGERPQWRDYWAQLYDYYTVLGCEYKITMMNPSDSQGQNLIVGTGFDSYSTTATSTGNVMPVCAIADAMGFKGMRWDVIMSNSPDHDSSIAVIKGRYKPGQTKRNVINDGDVKTWTAMGSTPNLTESLVLNFWRAPLQYYSGAGIATEATQPHCMNMQVELKYIVQYKDLKQQARYPNRTTTDQDITQILNEDSTATGSAHQRW